MSTKSPSHIQPSSSDALRASSVWASPEVLGFRPPPFNHVLLVSALHASCSTSRGSWLLPLNARHPLPARCHPPLDKQTMAASAFMSQGNGYPVAHSSALGQAEHAIPPATHSPTFLTQPHIFTAHLLCAWHCSRQMHPAFTELHLIQKGLRRRTSPPQQQQQLTVTGDVIEFARPRCTGDSSASPVTLPREGGWASVQFNRQL